MTTAAVTREHFTPPEVATMLGVDVHSILAFIRAGELRAANIGRGTRRPRYRIARGDIEAFLARRSVAPPAKQVRRVRRKDMAVTKYF